jgi:hypothetical protein
MPMFNESSAKKRFILLDPLIRDWSGHCGEYALRVLTAASKNYEPILVTHRAFETTFNTIVVFPVYQTNDRNLLSIFSWLNRFRVREHSIELDHRDLNPRDLKTFRLKRWAIWVRCKLGNWKDRKKVKNFIKKTLFVCSKLNVTEQDLIFIPNVQRSILLGLIKLFSTRTNAQWHVVLHMDPDILMGDRYEAQRTLQRLKSRLKGQSFFLYTDTESLTRIYNDLDVFQFKTLPIPVCPTYHVGDRSNKKNPLPLHVNYLGIARDEKGYLNLAKFIAHTHDFLASNKMTITIQSNFSHARDRVSRLIYRHLKQRPGQNVRLIEDSLHPVLYRDFLLSSDVVLIPYNADQYTDRSSGVFAECMASGIPVIIPAGTWMALQLNSMITQYQSKLIERYTLSMKRDQSDLIVDGTTHIGLRITCQSASKFMIKVIYYDRQGQVIDCFCCRAVPAFCQTMILPLMPNAHSVRYQLLGNPRVELHYLKIDAIPIGCISMIYYEVAQLKQCVQELIQFYAHYRQGAIEFSKPWSAYHNPNQLLHRLHRNHLP